MKIKFRVWGILILVLTLLTSCNEVVNPAPPPTPVISESPSIIKDAWGESVPGLPDAYRYRDGKLWLRLDFGNIERDRSLPDEVTFHSVEEMREKFLNLSFTESELAIIKRCMLDCESFAVIDPRLLLCIRLPEGASLRKGKIEFSAEHFNGFSNGFSEHYALIDFGTIDPPDGCDDYTKMIAEIKAYPAFGSQYKRRMEEGWTDDSGGFVTHYHETLKETVYKGRPALYMENNYGVCYRYTVKEGNRIYYVMETFGNKTDLTCGSICVQTFYDDYLCYYRYYSPSQDCIDNIFSSYNIFDFEEIVE